MTRGARGPAFTSNVVSDETAGINRAAAKRVQNYRYRDWPMRYRGYISVRSLGRVYVRRSAVYGPLLVSAHVVPVHSYHVARR